MGGTQTSESTVIVVDQNADRAALICERLRFLNYLPVLASGPGAPFDDADQHNVAIVIGDANDKDMRRVARRCPHTPVLIARSGQADAKLPDALADRPAWRLDFPVRRAQLSQLLRRAERYDGVERRRTITGRSRAIRKVRRSIEQVADFDTTVLVSGESGTGKELVARMIHDRSKRQGQPFVPINCGAIPADLLESELFGHEKGAFTGAISARTGRFALAEGGTLFLDEIGDMSLPMQVKLLRVLQERCFETVGSNKTRKCNVRIVAATHRDLKEMVTKGEFREDLYFRLNVFPIEMPPLCKRASDLPQLLDELLLQHGANGDRQLRVSPAALRALASYSWPGNIRELSNLVERLAIMKPEGIIETADLPEKYLADLPPEMPQGDVPCDATGCGEDLKGYLQSVEQDLIRQAMEQADHVVARAARLLNIRRTTLVEKLNKYALH